MPDAPPACRTRSDALEDAAGYQREGLNVAGLATPVKYPLLVQSCEVTLNEKTFDLEVRPRDVEPRLEADCYAEMELPGVRQLEAFWRSALPTGANRVNPFEASTFDGTLKSAVGHLDPSGAYEVRTDDVTITTRSRGTLRRQADCAALNLNVPERPLLRVGISALGRDATVLSSDSLPESGQ